MSYTNESFVQIREFKAVILAGGTGRLLSPLTPSTPKALLPVCNKPMIWYPLTNLRKHKIRDILVFCNDKHTSMISSYIEHEFGCKGPVEYDGYCTDIKVIGVEGDDTEGLLGTWTTLVQYGEKYLSNSDFFVIPCDVIGALDLLSVVTSHRITQAVCTVLLSKVNSKTSSCSGKSSNIQTQGGCIGGISVDIQRDKNMTIFTLDEEQHQIVGMKDYYSAKEENIAAELTKLQLFWHTNVTVSSSYVDLHVYLFKQSIFNIEKVINKEVFINTIELPNDSIESIRLDLVPFLIKMQHIPGSEYWSISKLDCVSFADEIDMNLPMHPNNEKYTKANLPPKLSGTNVSYCMQPSDDICIRVNTLLNYHECNLSGTSSQFFPAWLSHTQVNPAGKDVYLGDKCTIGKSTQIRRSYIGSYVNVGDGVKIVNCIIMDNVTIGNKCVIQNSIIGNKVSIGVGCKVSYCAIEDNFTVEDNSKIQNETLEKRDTILEIEV
ncbi:nucleotidyl transferase family protein [Cryptosporidium muris RN66]|uniref:Translation initiation factor eIF2B subunit gamma n=1 Tax=Cryptosporidium muris (strain RN66) TaxID=441375 RepID=B6AHF1_CRYMR|nr:nucleotidyl transferase family protein [Cryptosporidium muris RN66]EEA07646.1 nucleotidyl transferase family protein [Cryptosporidium muris RN66]|eukprot:XP_002141995.1 nucleotidyl transferase family protein [Cryptosporidium muris RN66]